ncbi:MAG: 5'-nucleotidase C-terminal domain-containing protein [Opitutales bacterium]
MKFRRLPFLFLAGWMLLNPAGKAAPAGAEALLIVTGDQHSAYDRTAQFVALVDRLKAENPGLPLAVLLDGDTLEYGNVLARRTHGAVDFAELAALARRAPTILNLGNHEPEFYDLAATVERVKATGVTVVTNITNRATGRPFAPASTLLPLGRQTAVVVGLTTDHLSTYRVAVRPSLDLADPVVWARANFPKLLATDPGPASPRPATTGQPALNIVLSHAGLSADRALLPLVPDGTLFAGAHDHLRFVQPFGRTVYFHSGAWNEYVSLAWLCRNATGAPRWVVEQERVPGEGPGDPEMAVFLAKTRAENLTAADRAVIGRIPAGLTPPDAARFAARALREAAGADAAFIGNTTFGGGLPAGNVTQLDFDACVRFDGAVFTTEVDGTRLARLLAAANEGPDTPFDRRRGEFNFADGPASIDPARRYRIATTDWGAKNSARYFGEPALTWQEKPGLKLKEAVQQALQK